MGAVTALLFAAKYPHFVKALVADNAFSDLETVCMGLKDKHFPFIPDFLVDSFIANTQSYIDSHINVHNCGKFEIKKLKPKLVIGKIKAPIFYLYSEDDKMVDSSHTK